MDCKKCNTVNPDDAIYCSVCGARLDGKKVCEACGKLIDESNVFCNYCGTRTDGKKVCKKCGRVYEGSFCPECGAGEEVKSVRAVDEKTSPAGVPAGGKKVMTLVQSSLILSAIIIMLIFSFIIGMSATLKANGTTLRETDTAFDMLFLQWGELSEAVENLQAANEGKLFFEAKFALYSMVIVGALAVGANLIVCIVYGILATVKFCKGVNRTESPMFKYLLPPVVSTLCALVVIKTTCNLGETISSTDILRIGFSAATIIEIVFVSLLLAGALVLEFILNGKKYTKNLTKYISASVAAVLLLLAASLFIKNFLRVESIKTGFFVVFGAILMTIGMKTDPLSSAESTLSAFAIVEFFVFAVCIAAVFVTLYFILRSMNKEKSGAGFSLAFCIVSVAAFLIFMIFGILISQKIVEVPLIGATKAALGVSPILGLVLSVAALAAIIVTAIVSLKDKKETE